MFASIPLVVDTSMVRIGKGQLFSCTDLRPAHSAGHKGKATHAIRKTQLQPQRAPAVGSIVVGIDVQSVSCAWV